MGRLASLLSRADEALFNALMARPELLPTRWRKAAAMYYPDARVRKVFWGLLGVSMGPHTFANPGLIVVKSESPESRVEIGDRVSLAANLILVTDSLPNNSAEMCAIPYVRDHLVKQAPIVIEDDVWIGAGVIVLPGIRIGRCSVIGAGAVVTRDVEPFTVVAGVPARVIRKLV